MLREEDGMRGRDERLNFSERDKGRVRKELIEGLMNEENE